MKKTTIILLSFVFFVSFVVDASSRRIFPERHYQEIWCANQGGRLEVVLQDGSRCDCVTDTHAIEFDFASKWAEAVGQVLLYSVLTGKRAGIVLIMEAAHDEVYLERLHRVIRYNGIELDVWQMK